MLGSGLALAQPASTADVAADPGARPGFSFTLGAGAGFAPDYEGSDDYKGVPLWNLRAGNLYHPETYVQVLGPHLVSNFLPDDHWRLGIAGQFIKERNDVEDDPVDALKSVDPSVMLGLIAGYDFLASPQDDLMFEVEGRQDVANDNGFLGTIRGRYGQVLAERWRFDALVATTWASEDYMSSLLRHRCRRRGAQRPRPVQRRRGLQGRRLRRFADLALPRALERDGGRHLYPAARRCRGQPGGRRPSATRTSFSPAC